MVHPVVRKFAPIAGMFALSVWCGWQFLEDASPLGDFEEKSLTRLDGDALAPQFPPLQERNMFAVGGVAANEARMQQLAEAAPPPFDPSKLLETLKLNGTLVHGAKRHALISGKVYAEGDVIASDNASGNLCRLFRVYGDSAVVMVDNRQFRLGYGEDAELLTPVKVRHSTRPQGADRRPVRKGVGHSLIRAVANSLSQNTPSPSRLPMQWKPIDYSPSLGQAWGKSNG